MGTVIPSRNSFGPPGAPPLQETDVSEYMVICCVLTLCTSQMSVMTIGPAMTTFPETSTSTTPLSLCNASVSAVRTCATSWTDASGMGGFAAHATATIGPAMNTTAILRFLTR